MRNLGRSFRDRILPAVLTAAGVALLAAGLLSYTGSAVAADPGASAAPSEIAFDPSRQPRLPDVAAAGRLAIGRAVTQPERGRRLRPGS